MNFLSDVLPQLPLLLAASANLGLLLLAFAFWHGKRQQRKEKSAHEQRLTELRRALTRSAERAEHLSKLLGAVREQVASQTERMQKIEQQDPRKLPISQAARLASMGTSKQDLARACGLSKSEADLVAKLHASRTPARAAAA